jgi:hypothetical protein
MSSELPPPSDPNKICDTTLDISTIEAELQKYFKTKNALKSFEAIEIGAGKGFLSVMARVKLVWATEDKSLPSSVVVKIPSLVQFERIKGQAALVTDEKMRQEMEKFLNFGKSLATKVYSVSEES